MSELLLPLIAIYWYGNSTAGEAASFTTKLVAKLCCVWAAKLKAGCKVRFTTDRRKPRFGGPVRVGPYIPWLVPEIVADCLENEKLALTNRALMISTELDLENWVEVRSFSVQFYKDFAKVEPQEFSVWNRKFSPERRAQHVRARDALQLVHFSNAYYRRIAKRKSFLKRELLLTSVDEKAPRLIQGATDEANVLLGPSIASFAEVVKKCWNLTSKITFASGMNANELGSWMGNNPCDYHVVNDFSKFDSTITAEALDLEGDIYKHMGLNGPALRVFMNQMFTVGQTQHGLVYECPGTRKSGDPNTTLGNSLINALVIAYALSKCGIDDFRILVGGDDCVISTFRPFDIKYFDFVLGSLGFRPKSKRVEPHLVDFYSSWFIPSSSGVVLTPKLGRMFAKIGFSVKPLVRPREWLAGVIRGNYDLYYHVPWVRAFNDKMLALLAGVIPEFSSREFKINVGRRSESSVEGRWALSAIYGISTDQEKSYYEWLSTLTLDGKLDHPVFQKFTLVDC
jgi:hypothetical protein